MSPVLCVCVLHTFQCFICSSFVGHLYVIDYAKAMFYYLHQHRINIRFTTRWRCCLYVCLLYIFHFPSYFSFPPFLKILNVYENIDRNMFFSLKKDSRTRGHEVKLVKDQCRLDIRKHSFSQRTINEWNKLSTDCVTASSVNMFKNKVDTYLRRAGYK